MKGHNLQLWAGTRSEVIAKVRSGPMANRARFDQTMSHLISSRRISRTISTRKALRKELMDAEESCRGRAEYSLLEDR